MGAIIARKFTRLPSPRFRVQPYKFEAGQEGRIRGIMPSCRLGLSVWRRGDDGSEDVAYNIPRL